MNGNKTYLDKNGRILIPIELRKDYKIGETFIIRKENDEIKLISTKKMVREAQMWAKENLIINEGSTLDDFLNHRRKDSGEF